MRHTVQHKVTNEFLRDAKYHYEPQGYIEGKIMDEMSTVLFKYYSDAIEKIDDKERQITTYQLPLYVRTEEEMKRSLKIFSSILEEHGVSEKVSNSIITDFKKYWG